MKNEGIEAPDEIYEIKLNRLFNILRKKALIGCLIENVIIILFFCLNTFREGGLSKEKLPSTLLTLAVLIILSVIINVMFSVRPNPKSIDVTESSVKFTHKNYVRGGRASGGVRMGGTGLRIGGSTVFPTTVTRYSVYEITKIEYKQTAIEKMLNAGHIRVHGRVSVEGRGKKGIYDEQTGTVTIYGITAFDYNSRFLQRYIKISK